MIAIINYGLGNVQAFATIYKRLGIPVRIAENEEELKGAEKIRIIGAGIWRKGRALYEKKNR